MKLQGGNRGIKDDAAEILDENKDRIGQEKPLDLGGKGIHGIENRRHVHQQHGKYTPEILDIPEENKHSRENQTDPNIEHKKKDNRIQEHDELPGEGDMVNDTKNEEDTQSQAKVNECLNVPTKEKEIFWHIDLRKDRCIGHQ